jgi:hypothetical protein
MIGQLLGPSTALVACRSVEIAVTVHCVHCPSMMMWYPRYPVDEIEDEEKEIVQLLTGKFDRRLIG